MIVVDAGRHMTTWKPVTHLTPSSYYLETISQPHDFDHEIFLVMVEYRDTLTVESIWTPRVPKSSDPQRKRQEGLVSKMCSSWNTCWLGVPNPHLIPLRNHFQGTMVRDDHDNNEKLGDVLVMIRDSRTHKEEFTFPLPPPLPNH